MWRVGRAIRSIVQKGKKESGADTAALRRQLGDARKVLAEALALCPGGCVVSASAFGGDQSLADQEALCCESSVHKWLAIIGNDVGDFDGSRAKIENGILFEKHTKRAIELLPKDATLRYVALPLPPPSSASDHNTVRAIILQ